MQRLVGKQIPPRREDVIEKDVDDDATVVPELSNEPVPALHHQRMGIGERVDLAMPRDSGCNFIMQRPGNATSNKIAGQIACEEAIASAATQPQMSEIVHDSIVYEEAAASRRLRWKRYLPAIFFVAGFTWDALTLGRAIKPVDLWILAGYLAGATAILVVRGRYYEWKHASKLDFILQFFLGGLFSALVIFYFLSSSNAPAFFVVAVLTLLLIGNEFLERRYAQLTVAWTMYAIAAVMFFNFALPHIIGSISRFWFYVSTAAAAALVVIVRRFSRVERVSVVPSVVAIALLVTMHATNLVPPVPLVQKRMLIAHGVVRTGGKYLVDVERRGIRRLNPFARQRFHARDRAYCFTSVFVPRGIETTLRHRWEYFEQRSGTWQTTDVISFTIRGGRDDGFRGYTTKRALRKGRWRVTAESSYGARLGVVEFVVVPGKPRTKTFRL